MPNSTSKNNLAFSYTLLGVLLIVIGWQVLSLFYIQVIFPSPAETIQALLGIMISGELLDNLIITFQRQIVGLTCGVTLGIISGIVAGLNRKVELICQPFIYTLLSVPAIVFVVMAMVWFGMGTVMAIFLVTLLVYPTMHMNTLEGFKSIDRSLLEMGQVYKLPAWITIKKIYLPGLTNSLVAGFSLSATASVRLTIMAELIGAREGIGQKIAVSRAYLETERLFAWVLVLLMIIIGLEFVIIRPLNAFSARWKQNYQ